MFSWITLSDINNAIERPQVKTTQNTLKFLGTIIAEILKLKKKNKYPIKGHGILSPPSNPKLNQGINDKKTAIPPTVFITSILYGVFVLLTNNLVHYGIYFSYFHNPPSYLDFLISKTNEAGSSWVIEYLNNVHRILNK